MILLLDTSSPECYVCLVDESGARHEYRWQADRGLAKGLLAYLEGTLDSHGLGVRDLMGVGFYRGPGSFTGLRIGAATVNAIVYSVGIPAVGETGEGWIDQALGRLSAGESDSLITPEYGREARITTPRK